MNVNLENPGRDRKDLYQEVLTHLQNKMATSAELKTILLDNKVVIETLRN